MRWGFGDCRGLMTRRPAVLDIALPYRPFCSSRTLQVLEDRLGEPMLREIFRLGERSPFLCETPLQILRRAYTKAQRKRFRQAWARGCLDVPTVLASPCPRQLFRLFPVSRSYCPIPAKRDTPTRLTTEPARVHKDVASKTSFRAGPGQTSSQLQNLRTCSSHVISQPAAPIDTKRPPSSQELGVRSARQHDFTRSSRDDSVLAQRAS